MSEYLERLKADLAEAQKEFQKAQQQMQAYQNTFQAAGANVQSYQRIVAVQTAKEMREQQAAAAQSPTTQPTTPVAAPDSNANTPQTNKTKLIRDALGQHPGASPADLFEIVKTHVGRAYLYSVLKRLRDKEEVMVRRKRYYLKEPPKPEDVREQAVM